MIGLQGRIPNTSAGKWFQCWMVLFTKEYVPITDMICNFKHSDYFGSNKKTMWYQCSFRLNVKSREGGKKEILWEKFI